jgi:hypothetical protein
MSEISTAEIFAEDEAKLERIALQHEHQPPDSDYIEFAPRFLAVEDPPVRYLVNELLPEQVLCLMHGEPRTRKSWAALEIAIALATAPLLLAWNASAWIRLCRCCIRVRKTLRAMSGCAQKRFLPGVREGVAMAISGHRTRAIFDRYNITSDDDLREAVKQTVSHLAAQSTGRKVVSIR